MTPRPADMVPSAPPAEGVLTLDNCASEPIHVPGHIQPHGVLLALDLQGRVMGWSENLATRLGWQPELHQQLQALPLGSELTDMIGDVLDEARDHAADAHDEGAHEQRGSAAPQSLEWHAAEGSGPLWDVVAHGHDGRVLVEFEQRVADAAQLSAFALKAHRLIDRLKRQRKLEALLQMAADQVRQLTGFDRVMVYRFRHDDSGDVVAEARIDTLKPLLGMRYPASDIPAQARRLYTLNTLRLIADVAYQPVPVLAAAAERPLDMSHSVLRSVSPVHVEYLLNMGVKASMSVSIVVEGRLWGLIACHHYAPLQVPYAVRMACDVMAQVLAANVLSMNSAAQAAQAAATAELRSSMALAIAEHDDMLRAFADALPQLQDILRAHAVVVAHAGKLLVQGPIDEALVREILAEGLPRNADALLLRQQRSDWPEGLRTAIGPWVGLMGLAFEPGAGGWVLALRCEQVETVRWGGKPEKELSVGPLGPRLTPRGSFDEWRPTVRDASEPWERDQVRAGRDMLADLQQAVLARHGELERARTQMLAMLGHDLRDPLHSINMAARVLERTSASDGPQRIGARIRSSSGRMQRLIGQVLDLSRLRSGIGLGMHPVPVDMAALLRDLCDEARLAHPGVRLVLEAPELLMASADADRMAQVVGNLLGNARHHGDPGQPVRVTLAAGDDGAVALAVRNHAPPIPEDRAARLFQPFKGSRADAASGHRGLGLGLYIAHEIVHGHGGQLLYRHEAPEVVFEVHLPAGPLAGVDGVDRPA